MSLGENIRVRRTACGYTVEELANRLGVSRQTVFRYENGQIATVPSDKLQLLSEILNTTPAQLLSDTGGREMAGFPLYDGETLPELTGIENGEPKYAASPYRATFLPGMTGERPDFCYVATGDGMIGARIAAGDILFLSSKATLKNGDIALILFNGELQLRHIYQYPAEGKTVLTAENPKEAPAVLSPEEAEQLRILGRVMSFQSALR